MPGLPDAAAVTPGNDIHYVYDALHRLVAAINPIGSTTRYSYDAVGNITSVKTKSSSTLIVDQVTPARAATGATVAIDGTGFSGTASADTVKFSGVPATVKTASTDHLTVTVPSGSVNGPVTVTTASGTAASAQTFTAISTAGPTITSFSPARVAAGGVVTIIGTHFSTSTSLDDVLINRTHAAIKTATATQITAVVPAATASGKIYVNTPNGTATSSSDLFITPSVAQDTAAGVTATLTPAVARNVSLTKANTYAQLTFDGSAGEHVAATLAKLTTGVAVFEFLDPRGNPQLNTASPNTGQTATIDARLTDSGRYSVYLEFAGAAGTAQVTLTLLNDPSITTTPGTAVTATAAATDEDVLVKIKGVAGHQMSFQATKMTGHGPVDLSLEAPNGATVYAPRKVFAGEQPNFIEPYGKLPFSGAYTIRAHFEAPGSLIFTAYDVQPDISGTVIVGAKPTPVSFTSPGQNAKFTFTGIAGQRIAVTIGNGTMSEANVEVDEAHHDPLYDGTATSDEPLWSDAITIPDSGTTTILINPVAEDTGTLTVQLASVLADLTGALTVGGAARTLTFTTPGQNADLTFSGAKGQKVALTTGAWNGDNGVYISVLDPAGDSIYDGSAYADGDWSDAITLPATSTYHIHYDPQEQDTGSVTASLSSVPADLTGALTVGGAARTLTVTTPGQNADLTFSGAKGEKVALTTGAWNGDNGVYISVLDPAGDSIYDGSAYADGDASGAITLPAAGTYHVQYDPQYKDTGILTSKLSAAAAAAPAAKPPATRNESVAPPKTNHMPPANPLPQQPAVPASTLTYRSRYSDAWTPNVTNYAPSPWETTPLAHAKRGVTALAGRVLTIAGMPLARVTLTVGPASTRTDASGRFLLTGTPMGARTLEINAATANRPGHTYGRYETLVDLAGGDTTILPFTIWMTRLDTHHTVRIPTVTTAPITVTTPRVPGLEVRIQAGSSLKDDDGKSVHRIGITPIPVARPPFPLPSIGVQVPTYFTVQPGSTYIDPSGAQIVYPNWGHLRPGTTTDFWNFDPDGKGWHVYGQGTVTANGRQVVPSKQTRVWEFSGAMFNGSQPSPPSPGPAPGSCDTGGDPISCATGLLEQNDTDLTVRDLTPLSIDRNYRQSDSRQYTFGNGMNFGYGIYLYSQQQYTEVDLILAQGTRIHYTRISDGDPSSFADGVFETHSPGPFFGSLIAYNGFGWDLTLPDGTVYVWGDEAPLQSIRDRYGNQTDITRTDSSAAFGSSQGAISQITGPHGRWLSFSYDGSLPCQCANAVQDNTGRKVTYGYDDTGNLTTVTGPRGGVTRYGYDASNRMTSVKDARGTTRVTFAYTGNRISSETMADGGKWAYAYTTTGSKITQTTITDPRGDNEVMTFDSAGYPLTDTYASGTPIARKYTRGYDSYHRLAKVTDPLDRVTTYAYDASGDLTKLTLLTGSPSARSYTATYDPSFTQMTSQTDPLGHKTTATYDSRGRLTGMIDPTGHATKYVENTDGQLAKVTSPNGHATTLRYRQQDLVSVTTPTGATSSSYGGAGGLPLQVTDPTNGLWKYSYDSDMNLTKQVDPLGGSTSFSYDSDNNLVSYTDPLKHSTNWNYTALNDMSKQTDPLSRTHTYSYDLDQNLTSVTDARGDITSYSYDALNRPLQIGYGATATHTTPTSTIALTWDAGNRITRVVDSANGTITRTWDNADDLTSETTAAGTIGYMFDAAGNRLTMTEPGGLAVSYTYDAANRPTKISQGSNTVTTNYDPDGNATSTALPGGITQTATFDAADRATALTWTHATTSIGTDTYSYDPNGDRATAGGSLSGLGTSPTISSASYDAANELASLNGTTYTYDKNGNLTSDGAHTYAWNARNQLTATNGTAAQTYGYDAFGRRASRTVGATTTRYSYDEFNAVQERTGTSVTATNLDGVSLDQHYARTDSGGTHTDLSDSLNTTLALSNASGAITTTYTYSPYGSTTRAGAASSNPYQFIGRENDGNGLMYLRARFQQPAAGRFLSPDPLTIYGDGPSAYAYAGDAPATRADPSGLCNCHPSAADWAVLAGGVAIAGVGVYFGAAAIGTGYMAWAAFGGAAFADVAGPAAIGAGWTTFAAGVTGPGSALSWIGGTVGYYAGGLGGSLRSFLDCFR